VSNIWQYYMFKVASRLLCLLPYSLLLKIGALLGRLYYRIAARQRNRALTQIQRSLAISPIEAEGIIRSLFTKLGQTFVEIMYMPVLTPAKIDEYVTFENRHYVAEALAEGKGVAVLTAHVGNWEWLAATLSLSGFPTTAIAKSQPNDQHTKIINEFREKVGVEVFCRGTIEMIAAARALKKGKILGFLSDQDAGVNGIFINFLGKMASTPSGVAYFVRKFDIPVVPMFLVRRPGGGHRVIISPPQHFSKTEDEAADYYRITAQITQIIEDVIRQYPDEWLWFQKRWNTEWVGGQN